MPPLSRLDLPHIVEAIKELYRVIESPPGNNWQPPAWLVAQCKQTTTPEVPANPSRAALIHYATNEVLNRMMPPWHHGKPDCPEITESSLDTPHKVALLELREPLLNPLLSNQLARNRSDALQFLSYLESALERLGVPGTPTPAAGQSEGAAKQNKQPKNRGRKPDPTIDPKQDKQIAESWDSGHYKGYSDLARILHIEKRDVEKAIDRHRKREARKGR